MFFFPGCNLGQIYSVKPTTETAELHLPFTLMNNTGVRNKFQ